MPDSAYPHDNIYMCIIPVSSRHAGIVLAGTVSIYHVPTRLVFITNIDSGQKHAGMTG